MPVATRLGRRAMSRARRPRRNLLALATGAPMGTVLLTAPSSSAAPTDQAAARRGTITINSPASGSTMPRPNIAAARATRVAVLVTVGSDVTVTSAQLNRHPVITRPSSSGRQTRPAEQAMPDLPAPPPARRPTSTESSCPMPARTPGPLKQRAGRGAWCPPTEEKEARS